MQWVVGKIFLMNSCEKQAEACPSLAVADIHGNFIQFHHTLLFIRERFEVSRILMFFFDDIYGRVLYLGQAAAIFWVWEGSLTITFVGLRVFYEILFSFTTDALLRDTEVCDFTRKRFGSGIKVFAISLASSGIRWRQSKTISLPLLFLFILTRVKALIYLTWFHSF